MDQLIGVLGVVCAVGFGVAAILAVRRVPARSSGRMRLPMVALALAMSMYCMTGVSDTLQYAGVTDRLDPYEDYAEILFVPLLLLAAFGDMTQERDAERARSARLLENQNELLVSVLETSPVGIMIVAPGGQVVFANEPARQLLRISEDPSTGRLVAAPSAMRTVQGTTTSLAEIVTRPPALGTRYVYEWRDGHKLQALLSVTPMSDRTAALGGAVVAVEAVADL